MSDVQGLLALPPGGDLFSHPVTRAVSSALKRFTTVFGMGTGGATSLEPPGSNYPVSMHHFSQIRKGFCDYVARKNLLLLTRQRAAQYLPNLTGFRPNDMNQFRI